MRRRRTIYFNDARHYYLFVFEPPMKLEDAWRPVDECAGTSVDTFVYGVQSGGLFYPSKVGMRYGADTQPMKQAATWRAWNNMQSLVDRGLDPLTVLIERAHDKGLDFFASMRLGNYAGMDSAQELASGGRGWVHPKVRDHQYAVLEELATEYAVEGVELDYAAPPGGSSYYFKDEDVPGYTPVMTEWVRRVSAMVRGRPGEPGQVGARVYPTEAINLSAGLDVRTWLAEGLLDYVVPMVYGHVAVDSNMPVEWLEESAHAADAAVYPMLQPYHFAAGWGYYRNNGEGESQTAQWATPEMMRAAAASYWDRGADGMYTWFLRWPLGDQERGILAQLGDPDLAKKGDKHYFVGRSGNYSRAVGYDTPLPLEIASSDAGTTYGIPFYVADDIQGAANRVRRVRLKVYIHDLVSADQITILLNGQSLTGETCRRDYGRAGPYSGQWLEFEMEGVRPRRGENLMEFTLDRRAEGLISPLRVEDVELIIEYGSYPSKL